MRLTYKGGCSVQDKSNVNSVQTYIGLSDSSTKLLLLQKSHQTFSNLTVKWKLYGLQLFISLKSKYKLWLKQSTLIHVNNGVVKIFIEKQR